MTTFVHGLGGPEAVTLVSMRHERRNARPVAVLRYQPVQYPALLLGGPHLTCIVDLVTEQLLGVTLLVESVARGAVPTSAAAQQTAEAHLAQTAPDVVSELDLVEIAPHTDVVAVDGYDVGIVGKDVRYYARSTGQRTRVVVGPDLRVITFERDTVWDHIHGRCRTPMWLDDLWIAAHDSLAPQPGPPAALAHADPPARRTSVR